MIPTDTKSEYKKTERAWTQDSFLNHIRKNKIPMVLFLLNGVKIQGILCHFDQNSIILKRDSYLQLIYKHAISTIIPHYLFPSDSTSDF